MSLDVYHDVDQLQDTVDPGVQLLHGDTGITCMPTLCSQDRETPPLHAYGSPTLDQILAQRLAQTYRRGMVLARLCKRLHAPFHFDFITA